MRNGYQKGTNVFRKQCPLMQESSKICSLAFRLEATRRADQPEKPSLRYPASWGCDPTRFTGESSNWRAIRKNPFPGKGRGADDETARLRRELAAAREKPDIQKSRNVLCQKPPVKCALMEHYRRKYSVRRMCSALRVSAGGCYA